MTSDVPLLEQVELWRAIPPPSGTELLDSAEELTTYLASGDHLLAGLPPKPKRTQAEQSVAASVLGAQRSARTRFVSQHAERIYDMLTEDRTLHRRLPDLVHAAAERFPGLAPARDQIAAERARPQSDKDGLEIDQGIFLRGILASPVAGTHLMDAMRMATPRAMELLDTFRQDGVLEFDALKLERHGNIADLTFQNDHCLNAEDDQLIHDMETAIDLVLLDDHVHVGVMRGGIMSHPRYRGKRVFSAGINLRELHAGRISFVDFLMGRELGYISKMIHGLLIDPDAPFNEGSLHKPWVAAVDSFAIGGGMQLVLAADWVVAADDAYFSLPAAQEGIVPGLGNLRLGRLTGSRLARRIILGGHRIRSAAPEAHLVCDEVVPAGNVGDVARAAALRLDNPAVVANRRMLSLAEEPRYALRTYLAEFAYEQAVRLYADDVLDKVGRSWSRPAHGQEGRP
ncbi:(3,5-dihydroxyphenyl)acetyl-CoA 1,2-dioxygenase DpgC [Streptomyces sp. ALI-76-A]|uniref:(3,5-dihydroxyphenyl)acetyl-CoA 1,2-dioxygenase DpgC n=1 Tax=Streptomyces sp. ALI-76-A TaxID=3025736 RepID=UPI00256F5CFD|nr:(3,5-dihydroxyphenyl)acetyl-CoA 1,2-dioxygenase DpgC [Streptomyces sp. ALI-76-A]MDL5199792.1 enoyl-CoA hydratase/isomerase family protein [Streptomyces sp. ALI-76-A]